jgi:hypothetical protein
MLSLRFTGAVVGGNLASRFTNWARVLFGGAKPS